MELRKKSILIALCIGDGYIANQIKNLQNTTVDQLLKKVEERKKRHQLIKEIKNKEFSLNIEFKNPYNDEQQNFSSFPYSIEFKNGKITKIDTFFTH